MNEVSIDYALIRLKSHKPFMFIHNMKYQGGHTNSFLCRTNDGIALEWYDIRNNHWKTTDIKSLINVLKGKSYADTTHEIWTVDSEKEAERYLSMGLL